MYAVSPVKFDIHGSVDGFKSTGPHGNREGEQHRRPNQTPGYTYPCPRWRNGEGEPQHQAAEPRVVFGKGVNHDIHCRHRREDQCERIQLPRGGKEDNGAHGSHGAYFDGFEQSGGNVSGRRTRIFRVFTGVDDAVGRHSECAHTQESQRNPNEGMPARPPGTARIMGSQHHADVPKRHGEQGFGNVNRVQIVGDFARYPAARYRMGGRLTHWSFAPFTRSKPEISKCRETG